VADAQLGGRWFRLIYSLWTAWWIWLAVFQIQRSAWGWALGNALLAALGMWGYGESVIDDFKSRAALAAIGDKQ
jgi:hypothetical protein